MWSSCRCVVDCVVVALVVHVAPDSICLSAHNFKFNCRVREISPFVPILCQRKLVHFITLIVDREISAGTYYLHVSLPESKKGDVMKNIKNSRSWYICTLSQKMRNFTRNACIEYVPFACCSLWETGILPSYFSMSHTENIAFELVVILLSLVYVCTIRDTSVNKGTDYGMKERVSVFGRGGCLFHANMTEVVHWTTQPCIPWLIDAVSLEVKRLQSSADH